MNTVEKLKDLIKQATEERSHYYVKSVCEESIQEIEKLQKVVEFYATHTNWNTDKLFSETAIIKNDMSLFFFYEAEHYCGGKRARNVLKELKVNGWK